MNESSKSRSLGTHDGVFHADEVTACAFLLLFNLIDEDKVKRTRDQAILSQCEFVCDVAGVYDPERKLFDHHQADYRGLLSSAGMVLKHLCDQKIISNEEYEFFNHSLVIGVDAHDNGRVTFLDGHCTFSHVIANFVPVSYDADDATLDAAFFEAVHFTFGHLKRSLERFRYTQECRNVVAQCMASSKECLIFDRRLPWLENFFALDGVRHPAKFVIMPAGNHWKLRGIPPTYEDRMAVRIPLPVNWAGLMDQELRKVSGIPGAIFCHKGRFVSVWETREDALKALKYTLENAL